MAAIVASAPTTTAPLMPSATATPATPKPPTTPIAPTTVKIYNAVYSSVQVYECMIRGIAVMRRRSDSFVNATQILKVAGVDKGRRTKILEKEILPGKHEIVQGGYGKYQGTWIPLDRGRDLASQYGVAPLMAPLFDFIPTAQANQLLPVTVQGRSVTPNRQVGGSPFSFQYNPALHSTPLHSQPPAGQGRNMSPTPILPGSALRLLNQGRAQGLFTPSTSSASLQGSGGAPLQGSKSPPPKPPGPPTTNTLKRVRSENIPTHLTNGMTGTAVVDISAGDGQSTPGPPPAKRPKTDNQLQPSPIPSAGDRFTPNKTNGKQLNGVNTKFDLTPRFATKSALYRSNERGAILRNPKRASTLTAIYGAEDDADIVLELLGGADRANGVPPDLDIVLDDQGHTALHISASLARTNICKTLVLHGADVRRGSFTGETALIRTVLAPHAFDNQSFNTILAQLYESIHTLDNSRRTVLHHIAHVAGVKGRAASARYYLECVLMWIAQREDGDFKTILDIQDEHGDTALNISARVGNRSIVKTLVEVGANRILPNKLGLRPGDFGVEEDDLLAPGATDVLSVLRAGPSMPTQKSEEVITEMTGMINSLSEDFVSEIKDKQIALEQAQGRLKVSTRQLAEQRRQLQAWQGRCTELEETQQRVRNLQRALAEEDDVDWTGRTEADKSPLQAHLAGLSFEHKGESSTLITSDFSSQETANMPVEPDVTIPVTNSAATLIRLRRMKLWHERIEKFLDDRMVAIKGSSAEREFQYKRIISMSTGLSVDQIEPMTSTLLIALESEPQMGDLSRISNFMQRVKDRGNESVSLVWNEPR